MVEKSLTNPHQVVHGGVPYSMADTGMGAAVYLSLDPGYLCATVEIKMTYFKPVYSGEIVCETKIINKGKRLVALESFITNNGQLVAKASGTYCIFHVGAGVDADHAPESY